MSHYENDYVEKLKARNAALEKVVAAAREYTENREYQNVVSCRRDQDRLEGILISAIHACDVLDQSNG